MMPTSAAAVTPAERDLVAAVASAPVTVTATVTERLGGPAPFDPWRVTVDPIGSFKLDGSWPSDLPEGDQDHDADDLDGYGPTRDDALADALRILRRVTWAVVTVMAWDAASDSLVMRAVVIRWTDGRLAVMPGSANDAPTPAQADVDDIPRHGPWVPPVGERP